MNKSLEAFAISIVVLILLVMLGLGLMMGLGHPLPWISLALLIGVGLLARRLAAKRFLTWHESYSVGIAVLDEDHKRLLTLINQLQTAAHYHTSDAYEEEALEALVDYTRGHFQREEALMAQYDFPGLAAHRQQHQEMIDEVGKLLTAYRQDRDATIERAIRYLQTWLLNHINGTDKEYTEFLHAKGVH
jgi:hemerythrin-like metal-binding protein